MVLVATFFCGGTVEPVIVKTNKERSEWLVVSQLMDWDGLGPNELGRSGDGQCCCVFTTLFMMINLELN